MAPSKHAREQTAFRLPEPVLAWLRGQAETEERSMTAIVVEALEAYRRGTTSSQQTGRIVPLTRDEPGNPS